MKIPDQRIVLENCKDKALNKSFFLPTTYSTALQGSVIGSFESFYIRVHLFYRRVVQPYSRRATFRFRS